MLGVDWEGFSEDVMLGLPAFIQAGKYQQIKHVSAWASELTNSRVSIWQNGSRLREETPSISTFTGSSGRPRILIRAESSNVTQGSQHPIPNEQNLAPPPGLSLALPGFTCFHTAFHSYFFGPGLPPSSFQQPSYNFGQVMITPAGVTLNGNSGNPLPAFNPNFASQLAAPSSIPAFSPKVGSNPAFASPFNQETAPIPIVAPLQTQNNVASGNSKAAQSARPNATLKKPIKNTSAVRAQSSTSEESEEPPVRRTQPQPSTVGAPVRTVTTAKKSPAQLKPSIPPKLNVIRYRDDSATALGKRPPLNKQHSSSSDDDSENEEDEEPVLIGPPNQLVVSDSKAPTYPVKTRFLEPGEAGNANKSLRYDGIGALLGKNLANLGQLNKDGFRKPSAKPQSKPNPVNLAPKVAKKDDSSSSDDDSSLTESQLKKLSSQKNPLPAKAANSVAPTATTANQNNTTSQLRANPNAGAGLDQDDFFSEQPNNPLILDPVEEFKQKKESWRKNAEINIPKHQQPKKTWVQPSLASSGYTPAPPTSRNTSSVLPAPSQNEKLKLDLSLLSKKVNLSEYTQVSVESLQKLSASDLETLLPPSQLILYKSIELNEETLVPQAAEKLARGQVVSCKNKLVYLENLDEIDEETNSPVENELYIDTFFELWVNHLTLGVKQKSILECVMFERQLPAVASTPQPCENLTDAKMLEEKKSSLLKLLAERERKVSEHTGATPGAAVVHSTASTKSKGKVGQDSEDEEAETAPNPKELGLKEHKEKYRAMAAVDSKMSPLEQAISHQVSYYFGDKNYHRDRYIQGHIEKDEDRGSARSDSALDIRHLLNFNKIREKSTNLELIRGALVKFSHSEMCTYGLTADNNKLFKKGTVRPTTN